MTQIKPDFGASLPAPPPDFESLDGLDPGELSRLEAAAADIRGGVLADEVNTEPKAKPVKPKPAAPAEPATKKVAKPKAETVEVEPEVEETEVEDEGEPEGEAPKPKAKKAAPLLGFLKAAEDGRIKALEGELELTKGQLAEIETYKKKSELTLRRLLDDADSETSMLSPDEKLELAEWLISTTVPADKLDKETALEIQRRRAIREREVNRTRASQDAERIESERNLAKQQQAAIEYRIGVKEHIIDNVDKYPAAVEYYGGRQKLGEAVYEAARYLVQNKLVKTAEELEPAAILTQIEKEIEAMSEEQGKQSKKAGSVPTQKRKQAPRRTQEEESLADEEEEARFAAAAAAIRESFATG